MPYALIDQNNAVVQYPLFEADIKSRHPNTSFCTPFVAPDNYVSVRVLPEPLLDWNEAKRATPPALVDGAWIQGWDIETVSESEAIRRTESQAVSVRTERNKRLADCDWTQLSDAPVDAAVWATYRQALRDITQQEGFPWDVSWPDKP